jgi:hypothetical protein
MVGGRGPMISQRTKVALAEAKRRGTRLGGDRGVKKPAVGPWQPPRRAPR